jgi:hypothetical protein
MNVLMESESLHLTRAKDMLIKSLSTSESEDSSDYVMS